MHLKEGQDFGVGNLEQPNREFYSLGRYDLRFPPTGCLLGALPHHGGNKR